MKITINDEEILTLSDTQKAVIRNDISDEIFEADMARRLHYINDHPCEQCIDRNSASWRSMLKQKGISSIPSDRRKFAELAVQQGCLEPCKESADLIVKIDGVECHRIDTILKAMIKKMRACESVDEHCKEQMKWVLTHKYERCMERLRREWEPKLASRMDSLPVDDEEFAKLVFSQPDYKSRSVREKQSK